MNTPLMPKATAVWLVDNTALTFAQIAEFCDLHELEVKGIADGDVAAGIVGLSPPQNNQLTREKLSVVKRMLMGAYSRKTAKVPCLQNRSRPPLYPLPAAKKNPMPLPFW